MKLFVHILEPLSDQPSTRRVQKDTPPKEVALLNERLEKTCQYYTVGDLKSGAVWLKYLPQNYSGLFSISEGKHSTFRGPSFFAQPSFCLQKQWGKNNWSSQNKSKKCKELVTESQKCSSTVSVSIIKEEE